MRDSNVPHGTLRSITEIPQRGPESCAMISKRLVLGFFGAHEGGPVEGLDHLWIPVKPGTVIGSWADGTVLDIQNIDGSYYVDIDYGQGLVGKHEVAERVLVAVGQHVKASDPGGANVSPFDYLKPDVQAAVIARHVNEVVNPYFTAGSIAGNSRP
jgi:hypothetical protein